MNDKKKPVITMNGLMRHIRDAGIDIAGSEQKHQLMLMGYFHSYKGYRYCKTPDNLIPYKKFSELEAVINFDSEIKSILYRPIMQLETALKSIAVEVIVHRAQSESFNVIMDKLMHADGHKDAKDYRKRKYKMRDEIQESLTEAYTSKRGHIVNHYYNQDRPVPIWAVFETITLGQFGTFISLLDAPVKEAISKEIGLPTNINTGGVLLAPIISALQSIRNAIAHNNMIFDGRYRADTKDNRKIADMLMQETQIKGITMLSLGDFIVLIFYLMAILHFKKRPIYNSLKRTTDAFEQVFGEIGASLYMKIFPNDTKAKIQGITTFVRKS